MREISGPKILAGKWVFLLFVIAFLSPLAIGKERPPTPGERKASGTLVPLTLIGYNYTNRYIDQFSVDGEGGGNLAVSGPHGGEGGSACCVNYVMGADAWKAIIRWQSDACIFNEGVFSNGVKHHEIHSFFREVEVQIDPHVPDHPRYLEIHIYPDGHAEAAITEHSSPTRLQLKKEREDKSVFKRCPNNVRPVKQ